jgi:hypothetical protein
MSEIIIPKIAIEFNHLEYLYSKFWKFIFITKNVKPT